MEASLEGFPAIRHYTQIELIEFVQVRLEQVGSHLWLGVTFADPHGLNFVEQHMSELVHRFGVDLQHFLQKPNGEEVAEPMRKRQIPFRNRVFANTDAHDADVTVRHFERFRRVRDSIQRRIVCAEASVREPCEL